MLYGEKEVTMDEISLITDSLREKVGRNVNVIWGTGKDETLGDKLRVAVIATGFNNNRGRATAATEQKIETATTTSAKKPYFKVEPLPTIWREGYESGRTGGRSPFAPSETGKAIKYKEFQHLRLYVDTDVNTHRPVDFGVIGNRFYTDEEK